MGQAILRTRHMDARHWWITDWQEERLIKVEFVSTVDNIADIGTKNVSGDVLERHLPKLQSDRPKTNQD